MNCPALYLECCSVAWCLFPAANTRTESVTKHTTEGEKERNTHISLWCSRFCLGMREFCTFRFLISSCTQQCAGHNNRVRIHSHSIYTDCIVYAVYHQQQLYTCAAPRCTSAACSCFSLSTTACCHSSLCASASASRPFKAAFCRSDARSCSCRLSY